MARRLPTGRVTFRRASAGVVAPPTDVVAVIGCSSDGEYYDPYQFSDENTLAEERGIGPGVKAGAYSIARTGAPILFCRVPATARAAYRSALDLSEVTGTATPTASGTPTDGYDVVIRVTTGGTIGTNAISYTVSTNGGDTAGTPQTMAIVGPYTIVVGGVTLTFTPAQTLVTNDVIRFYTLPASAAILTQTITRAEDPPSTGSITLSGTPADAYEVLVEVLRGGTAGTAGMAVRYALDGGASGSFSRELQLGTETSLDLLDGDEPSGLTVTFGVGEDFDAGDAFRANTTAPEPSAADVTTALERLDQSQHLWSFLHVIAEATPTFAGTIGSALAALASDANGDETYTMACLSARDRTAGEDDTSWSARLLDDFANLEDARLAVGAGMARITCPITGRRSRRPVMWAVVPRVIEGEIQEDPGKVRNGPLTSDVAIYENNLRTEHDAKVNDVLHRAGFVTLRTHKRRAGVYVTRGNLFSEQDSTVDRIARRRVLDLCAEVLRQTLVDQLENDLFPNPDGTLLESDAADIDLEIETAILQQLGGAIAGVQVRVSRTDQVFVTGRLSGRVTVNGVAYIDEFVADIGYQSPQLARLREQAATA